jgi:hypothetical protein
MFHECVETATSGPDAAGADDALEADSLLAAFEACVHEAIEGDDRDQILNETELDSAEVLAVLDGDVASLTVEAGAAVLATTVEYNADTIVAELRDHLLLGMTTAVLDVDTIAAEIAVDLTGQEVQQALEGRTAMTLEQLADVLAVIERRKR